MKAEIGIIGGSGLYSMPGFEAAEEMVIKTPFGDPSDNYVLGKLAGKHVAFLTRHGRGHRISPFFGDGLVAHISFADPICPQLADVVSYACMSTGVNTKKGGTYLCMEGPAFSTKAESNVYRSWGMDVIGMTNLQEAKLA